MALARVAFISNNFPSHEDPARGFYNLSQVKAVRSEGLSFEVLAPRPWFPLVRSRHARRLGSVAQRVEGFSVSYPRVLYLPMSRGPINGWLFALSLRRRLVRLCRALEPRFLWSSFAFPDGVGVGRIARQLGISHVVSIVGSDLNANLGRPGRMAAIEGTLREASVVLAKSRALRESLLERGVPGERVFVDYNGVDARVFHPLPRAGTCGELGVPAGAKRVLFVGSLVPVKNVPVLVGAFDRLRRQMSEPVELAIVGGGFLASSVRRELDRRGLGGTVRMVGPRAPAEVAAWLGASDVLCLPSRSEGVPNVVLEALACGRPVVASAVGGIPEVHPGAEAGDLVRPGDEEALAQALRSTLSREWQPAELSRLVKDFTWEANARRVVGWFEAAGLVGEDLAP